MQWLRMDIIFTNYSSKTQTFCNDVLFFEYGKATMTRSNEKVENGCEWKL